MRPPYPPDAAPYRFGGSSPWEPLRGRLTLGRLGLCVFLVSATVLFAAGLAAYLIGRYRFASAPPPGALEMPPLLWVSTGILLVSTAAAHRAGRAARRGDRRALRRAVLAAFALALAFIAVQAPALVELLRAHRAASHPASAQAGGVGLYGLALVLILIHAAHVLGGLAPLGRIAAAAARNRLGPAHERLIGGCAAYWHFLDVIWLILFATLLLTG